jgi:hypothetical protein
MDRYHFNPEERFKMTDSCPKVNFDRFPEPEGEKEKFQTIYNEIMATFIKHSATKLMTDEVLSAVRVGLEVVLACRPCEHDQPVRMYLQGYRLPETKESTRKFD